jgi:predicted lipoprotein with Yx(FWY)xxD motif
MERKTALGFLGGTMVVFAFFVAVLFLGEMSADSAGARLASAAPAPEPPPTVTVRNSDYGRILFDGEGRALYAFTRDSRGASTCAGACAAAWPPYVVEGSVRAGSGAEQSLLATIRRAGGGRQVAYAGRPLYYYVGDREPGQVLCQNVVEFGGTWLVIRPSGRLVR